MKEDTFVLEQRLDRALEEERLNQQVREEEELARQAAEDEGLERPNQQQLDEDRLDQQAFEEEARWRQQAFLEEEEERLNQQPLEGDGLNESERFPGSTFSPGDEHLAIGGGADGAGEDMIGSSATFQAQQEDVAEAMPHQEFPDGGVSGVSDQYGRGEDVDDGSVGVVSEEQEVDFVGDDEEDNVWQ